VKEKLGSCRPTGSLTSRRTQLSISIRKEVKMSTTETAETAGSLSAAVRYRK
jgi:hypothetical protein